MEIKRSYIYFDVSERQKIRKLIEKKYQKTTTSIDFRNQLGRNGENEVSPISEEILNVTEKLIGGSTVERLIGSTSKVYGISPINLDVVAEYLDFENHKKFIQFVLNKTSSMKEEFKINDLFKTHLIAIEFGKGKTLTLRIISDKIFEVVESKKTKFKLRDTFSIKQLEIGRELLCENVVRKTADQTIMLGAFTSGSRGCITNICLRK